MKRWYHKKPDMSKLNGNVRKRIKQRDGGCVECNATEDLTVHHIIPLSDGGTHHESNLVTLCLDCHKELHGVRCERRFRRVW